MKILSIDVGEGTQDIMLYNSDYPIENSIKMVLPSPTRILAEKIREHRNDLFLSGETMGGGPINKAIKDHLQKGYRVLMTPQSARTLRDNLKQVQTLGVEIVPEREINPDIEQIELKDVNLEAIKESLSPYELELEFDYLGVAVQDHGYQEGLGDRDFRLMKIKEKLAATNKIEELAHFGQVPEYLTRMKGVLRTLKGHKVTLMDSKFASICGATCDEFVQTLNRYVAIDVGNGHTLAVSIKENKICGFFEHHTHMLTPNKFQNFIVELVNGTLINEQIHGDGGHGAWIKEPLDGDVEIIASGPRRKILLQTDFQIRYAAPAGDVMMTGPVGLIKAIQSKYYRN